ncbi:MAG: FtsW/RodA/SpoVE family cell cycle protein [Bacteroidales bacterium]|nr:FtsW/RodA/SpoVE family cell cycle protein [Bacteroidales bacterium]
MHYTRSKEAIWLIATTLIILAMAWSLSINRSPDFSEAATRYANKTMVQLDSNVSARHLANVLIAHELFTDTAYAHWVAHQLKQKLNKHSLPNLGALNKRDWQVPASHVALASSWGQQRVQIAQALLGQDTIYKQAQKKALPAIVTLNVNEGYTLSGRVENDKGEAMAGVIVRLRRELSKHVRDSLTHAFWQARKQDNSYMALAKTELTASIQQDSHFAKTDASGRYRFEGLVAGQSYSVLPIATNQSFGRIRGVASIDRHAMNIDFTAREHRLPLFDQASFTQLRSQKLFTIRTPEQASQALMLAVSLLIASFWLLHACLALLRRQGDQLLLPLLYLLVGSSVMILFAVQDPLRDLDYGTSTAHCTAIVVTAAAVVCWLPPSILVRIANFSLPSWLLSRGVSPKFTRILAPLGKPQGLLFLGTSILLILLLAILGSGPEGSGVKVNIGPIQISEVSKYLMVAFMAYFFTAHHNAFREIENNVYLFRRYCLTMLVGFIALMALYIGVVGDQGPALVLCVTFLIYYAYARNAFGTMLATGVGYAVLLWLLSHWLNGTLLALASIAIVTALFVYALRMHKHEVMPLIVLLMSSFVVLQALPFTFAERLAERNSMFTNTWHNPLHGGDQVAQGIWALASGGWFGQGLGLSEAHVMPAYHTDMIFETIGETLGSMTLVGLLACFIVLFFRTILIARGTGHRLLFYLILGSGLVTLVQASIIIGGSLGLLPLTGISLPFLSKGNSGLMVNLAVFLLILLYSQWRSTPESQALIGQQFDRLNTYVILTFGGVAVCFIIALGVYGWQADSYMVRPVQVLSRQGEWLYSENPRIKRIARELHAGSIYDRKGVLLATSDRKHFLSVRTEAAKHGANMAQFDKQKHGQHRRYYPYGDAMLLWLGDANHMLAMSEQQGFAAEQRLRTQLRGFTTPILSTTLATSQSYREAPYLPKEQHTTTLVARDYSAFIPLLKAGKRSTLITQHNAQRHRDVRLSVDLRMQQQIARIVQSNTYAKYKTSAVVIKTKTGDVLAAANNPAPSANALRTIAQFPPRYYDMLLSSVFGYNHLVADRDFALMEASSPGSVVKPIDALAYLNRSGLAGTYTTYYYQPSERIRPGEPVGPVNLRTAIIKSSNLYFISLMNEEAIHPELFHLYQAVGASYYGQGGYFLTPPHNYNAPAVASAWLQRMSPKGKAYHDKRLVGTPQRYKGDDYSWMAWGQGPITATPLHFARLFGALANGGTLYANRFVIQQGDSTIPPHIEQQLAQQPGITEWLNATLAQQTAAQDISTTTQIDVRGKTGSPERTARHYNIKRHRTELRHVTDGWFVCYLPQADYEGSPLALCVRIQGMGGSKHAAMLAKSLIATLKAHGMAKH